MKLIFEMNINGISTEYHIRDTTNEIQWYILNCNASRDIPMEIKKYFENNQVIVKITVEKERTENG